MTRWTAIKLLFWFHEREAWRKEFLQYNSFVWPPFPREDEYRDLRIKLYEQSTKLYRQSRSEWWRDRRCEELAKPNPWLPKS